jgi:hypothetical protein
VRRFIFRKETMRTVEIEDYNSDITAKISNEHPDNKENRKYKIGRVK